MRDQAIVYDVLKKGGRLTPRLYGETRKGFLPPCSAGRPGLLWVHCWSRQLEEILVCSERAPLEIS